MNRKDLFQEHLAVTVIKGIHEGKTGKIIECKSCIIVELTNGLEIEIHEDWIEPSFIYYVGAKVDNDRFYVKARGIKEANTIASYLRKRFKYITINERKPKSNKIYNPIDVNQTTCYNKYIIRN
ncbi:hypothetical protein mgb1_043 [Bacillus phage MG-B1]|uniref:Uncharacterized protein n=1 Tax=Bacillus phage MG-B1 TaxID=1309583 RepID=M4W8D9_9CAUD|nr:hypothetical protein mgb1_043 [Bacillus phage MG-B1]AGI10632.1 hypothetical protein mgb1_043 [Bacillus phage MG-B1]